MEAAAHRAHDGAEPAEAARVRRARVGDHALQHVGVEHRGERLGRRALPRPAAEGERLLRVLAVQRERERELGARLEEGGEVVRVRVVRVRVRVKVRVGLGLGLGLGLS